MEREMTAREQERFRAETKRSQDKQRERDKRRDALANRLHGLLCKNEVCLGLDREEYVAKANMLMSYDLYSVETDRTLNILETGRA